VPFPQLRVIGPLADDGVLNDGVATTYRCLEADFRYGRVEMGAVDGLRAFSTAFACVSLARTNKLNQFGFGRSRERPNLTEGHGWRPIDIGSRSQVIDIAHQPGFAPQPALWTWMR
jgi:hypothetical protein